MSSFAVSHNLLLGAPTGTLIGNYSGVLTAALNPSQVRNMLGLSDILAGPISSTDNAVVRFDGLTGKLLQDSNCTINDSGILRIQSLDTTKYLELSHNNTIAILNDTGSTGLEVRLNNATCIQLSNTTVTLPSASVLSATTVRAPGSSHSLGSAGYELGSGLYIRWSSNGVYTGAKDWGIERTGSGVGRISNGGAGYGSLITNGLTAIAGNSSLNMYCNNGLNGATISAPSGSMTINPSDSLNVISNRINFNPGGNGRSRLDTTGWQIANNYVYGFSSSTSVGTIDTAIGRTSSAGLESNNGTLGSYRDFTSRNSIAYGSVVARSVGGVANVDEIRASYSGNIGLLDVGSGNINIVTYGVGSNVLIKSRDIQYFFDDGTGFGFRCPGNIGLSANLAMASASKLGWSSNSAPTSGFELVLAKNNPSGVEINNGTNGNYRDLYLRNLISSGYCNYTEITAPPTPSTNEVRIYAVDNGAGKTQLMAKFDDGSTAQIVIQP